MKKLLSIFLIIFIQQFILAQQKFIGIDLGYQLGKNQYFESGLNFTIISKNVGGSLTIGIENNLNSKSLGYKFGIAGFLNKYKTPPLYLGLNLINYQINKSYYKYIRPEIGLSGSIKYGGRDDARINLIYGYNIKIKNESNNLNNHLVRISVNSSLIGFIKLIGYGAYRFASIFKSNWS